MLNHNGFNCLPLDIDECSDGTAECPTNSQCINAAGSYQCQCNSGFIMNMNGNNTCDGELHIVQ